MSDSAGVIVFVDATTPIEAAVADGVATIAGQRGYIGVGFDGSNYRFNRTNASGQQVFVGAGTAGTPVGGVLSVQGVSGGQALLVSAASLPLPTGAATEATLATRATETTLATRASEATLATLLTQATFTARVPVNGQALMAASIPVVIASNQSAIPITDNAGSITIDTTQLPAALVGARLDTNVGAWLGSTTPTVGQKAMAASLPVVVSSDQSTLPVSVATLPLPAGAATEATLLTRSTETTLASLLSAFNAEDFATETTLLTRLSKADFEARINTLGQKAMAASSPMVIASDQSEVASKNAVASQVDGHSVAIGATTDADTALTVIGRLKQVITKLAAGLPAALVAGRLDTNTGSWLGSTAPTVGQKARAESLPVTLPTDQPPLPVTFTAANARTGISDSLFSLGGGTAGNIRDMRATTYTEPTAAAQRSFSSSSVNDAAAGTGARTIEFIYFDDTGDGPFTETLTLNGTTAVNTVATNIRFIEKMRVRTAGSLTANAGTITMHSAVGGGGTVIGTIGVGTVLAAVGDNQTLWAHHYVPLDWTAELAVIQCAIQSGGSGTSGTYFIRSAKPLVAGGVEIVEGGYLLLPGSFQRSFQFHSIIVGFARLTAFVIPSVNNTVVSCSFDWSETPD